MLDSLIAPALQRARTLLARIAPNAPLDDVTALAVVHELSIVECVCDLKPSAASIGVAPALFGVVATFVEHFRQHHAQLRADVIGPLARAIGFISLVIRNDVAACGPFVEVYFYVVLFTYSTIIVVFDFFLYRRR